MNPGRQPITTYSDSDYRNYSYQAFRVLQVVHAGHELIECRRTGQVFRAVLKRGRWLIYPKQTENSQKDNEQTRHIKRYNVE